MRRLALLAALPAALLASPGSAWAQSAACVPARTALVLSGGAAKGFAHIGVLEVLDSLGVKPDLIVGTSVGALVGALYASGYSARQVDSVVRQLPFESLVRTYDPAVSTSIGLLKPLAVWERGATGYRLQTGASHAGQVNALLASVTLRGNLLARGEFDSLPIPFRAVATDLVNGRPYVLSSGDLGHAVRASVALPLVFQPVHADSTWLSDGGLAANTPIAVARALGAARLWVSRLPSAPPDPNTFDDPFSLSETLINTLFKDDTTRLGPGDVDVVNPTYAFGVFDFRRSAADSLTRLGHDAASAAFRGATCVRPLNDGAARPARGLPVAV
ncbi:MAG TPA: patatin-like phospholipase family protein, partial [Gemmatimonadaceae bacterium]|nr:patatin-like phospholipase family protein [Gemmatimonadaceae bacterium]